MNELKKIVFLGIPLDALTMQDTINMIDLAILSNRRISQVSLNAGKLVSMQKDKDLFRSVVCADIINADGQSIVWAARLFNQRLPERVAGCDLMQNLIELASKRKYKCFFFGAQEEIVKKVVEICTQKYSTEIIGGYRNGYFTKEEEPLIAKQIAESGSKVLFVALSSPIKENFLFQHRKILESVNFTMGVGGTFDIIAGLTKRAPKWMQHIGMEWVYRLLQEPERMWRRYLVGNLIFIYLVIKEKFKRRNN